MLFSCKKDSGTKPVVLYDLSGTWSLYSWKANIPYNIDVNADQYPCIAENELVFRDDHTTSSGYTGADTCYVTHDLTNGPGLRGTVIGLPGQGDIAATWFRTENDVYIGSEHGVMSLVGGKLLLTISDTITVSGSKFFVTTVNIKK